MIRNLTFFVVILLFAGSLQVQAQTDPTNYVKPDIIPPSPTAAALSRYGNVPVTMYTGMANVSIPVFTVQGNDLSLPISLTYNYNGLKPAEQISWVGLGWALQAGGVITHNVKGNDDEYNTSSPYSYENTAALYTQAYVDTNQTYLSGIANRTYDAEPDIYSFNFAGHSGKFARVKNRFVLFPIQKIKISGGDSGYTITTEDGIMWSFTEIERTQTKSSSGTGSIPTFTSAWYLTKVVNAARTDSITLHYDEEDKVSQPGAWSQTLVMDVDHGSGTSGTLGAMHSSMPTWVQSKRLTSIRSSKYDVEFVPETSIRQDVGTQNNDGTYALAGINISANGGGTIKQFHLNHTYFNPTSAYIADKYLRLLSVSEIAGTDSLTHRFDYYEPYGLPTRFTYSTGTDHFSYYNGGGGTTLIPTTVYPAGVNRTPNMSASLGALTKVTYPTGGSTSFDYELNQSNTGNNITLYHNFSLFRARGDTLATDIMTDTASFYSNTGQYIHLVWSRTPKTISGDGNLRFNDPEVHVYQYNSSDPMDYAEIYSGKMNNESQDGGIADSVLIGVGRYLVDVVCDAKENRVDLTVGYKEQTDIPETVPGAGIRVKTITDDPLTGPPVVKKYKYEFGGGSATTYDEEAYIERIHDIGLFTYTDHHYFAFNSTLAQSETPGLPHYYSKVTEDAGSDTVNVKRSVYYFQCFEEGGNNLGVEPAEEQHFKKTSAGFTLLSSKLYQYSPKYTDTIMFGTKPYVTLLDETGGAGTKTYSANSYTLFSEWKFLQGVTETIYNADTLNTQSRNHYDLATRNLTLTQQTNSDGKVISQKMKYPEDYTSTLTGNLVAANVVAPVVEKQVWQKRSATDSVLIGGTVTKYDSLLYKPTKIYALENTNGQATLSSETKDGAGRYNTLLSDNNYKQRVTYSYDATAKLTAQQLTGGVTVAYQYGYPDMSFLGGTANNTYPIAECKNATTTEFYTDNFEDDASAASGTAAHTGSKYYNGNAYTVSWVRPNSRAYVISYWYKSGGAWKYTGEVAYTGSSYTLSGGTAYDDIRIYPADAQLSTYTYYPGIGISSTIDAKGLTSFYEYDAHNRLDTIKDQYGRILKNHTYNYAH